MCLVWNRVQGGGTEEGCRGRRGGRQKQESVAHRTLRKVLVSSARGSVPTGTHRGLRDSGQHPPAGNTTSAGGDPPREGGTKVGHRKDKVKFKSKFKGQAHTGPQEALGEGGGNASGKAGGGGAGLRAQDRVGQKGSTGVQGVGAEVEGTSTVRGNVAKEVTQNRI